MRYKSLTDVVFHNLVPFLASRSIQIGIHFSYIKTSHEKCTMFIKYKKNIKIYPHF